MASRFIKKSEFQKFLKRAQEVPSKEGGNSSGGWVATFCIVAGLLLIFAVKTPELIWRNQETLLRFWLSCDTQGWPDELKPIVNLSLSRGVWETEFRGKALDFNNPNFWTDCKIDKVESNDEFTVKLANDEVLFPKGPPNPEEMLIPEIYEADPHFIYRLDDNIDLRSGSVFIKFTKRLDRRKSLSSRKVQLNAVASVSVNEERMFAPGDPNAFLNLPFSHVPVLLTMDQPETLSKTSARILGTGLDRRGQNELIKAVSVSSAFWAEIVHPFWAIFEQLVSIVGPALFGFGLGLFTSRWK